MPSKDSDQTGGMLGPGRTHKSLAPRLQSDWTSNQSLCCVVEEVVSPISGSVVECLT